MAYVQNKNRNAALKSGPLASYSDEIREAQEKDIKNQEEKLKLKFEQERNIQVQRSRDSDNLERIRIYKEKLKQRKAASLTSVMGRGFRQSFSNRVSPSISGTMRAQRARHEGGSTAKG